MAPLQALSILLLILPSASCFGLKSRSYNVHLGPLSQKINCRARNRCTSSLSLGFISDTPSTDANIHNTHVTSNNIVTTSITKATTATPAPYKSVPPIPINLPSININNDGNNSNDVIIPDMTTMPGGMPRSGNAFIVESFRDLFNGPRKAADTVTAVTAQQRASSLDHSNNNNNNNDNNVLYIPSKQIDMAGRYADLLNRIPLAATVYALVDFFLINTDEDVAVGELLERELNDNNNDIMIDEIMDVEASVVKTRFLGLFLTVVATVAVSLLVYHPVPFNEL